MGSTVRGGERIIISMPRQTKQRLRGTCFRGYGLRRAGNFSNWESFDELLFDKGAAIRHLVRQAIAEATQRGEVDRSFTESLEVECTHPVGWSSTAPRSGFTSRQLESFAPNRRSQALRVRPDCGCHAPKTNFFTLVCAFRHVLVGGQPQWIVQVFSAYPGRDIGDLVGDVSAREDVVFYGWEHEGEVMQTECAQ